MVDADQPQWAREQAAAALRAMIADGKIGPRLPSHMALAGMLGVSPMTVQRALAILKDEGLIRSVPGLGTFISER